MATLALSPQAGTAPKPRSIFLRGRTWWLILGLLVLADQGSLFTEATNQGKALMKVRQYYDVSSPFLILSTLLYYVITISLMWSHLRETLRGMLRQPGLLYLALFALLSAMWSQEPQTTLRKLPYVVLMMAFGCYFANFYSGADQKRIICVVGLIVALSSAFFAIFLPRYGLDTGGAWKGILGQKNQLGHAILFLFAGIPFQPYGRHLKFWLLSGFFGLGVIVMSRSAGTLLLAMILILFRIFAPLYLHARRERRPALIFFLVSGVAIGLAGRELFFNLVGRDSTLTGRTEEWAVLIPLAMKHFWVGYGYQGFWTGSGDSLMAMKMVGGAMRGADSGYVDVLLQFGVVGLVLFIIIFLNATKNFFKVYSRRVAPPEAYWYFGLVLLSLIGNLTDAFFPLTGGTPEFLFIVACYGLERLNRTTST